MFYIQKSNNSKPIYWEYYCNNKYSSWAYFIVFATGYNTKQEAENKLVELGLIEEKNKIRIIKKK